MSLPGRGKASLGMIPTSLMKQIAFPGAAGYIGEPGQPKAFNTLQIDQLFPLTGMDNNPTFYIRQDGMYDLYFQVRQPSAWTVGWGNGFSGDGGGYAWIQTNRYGQQALQQWAGNWDTALENWMYCYVGKQQFYYGDWVQFYTQGWATGLITQDYDPLAYIRKWRS